MYTETIMRKVEADGELTSFNAVKMHGKEVKELRYAGDTVLFAQISRKGSVDYCNQSRRIVKAAACI